MTPPSDSAAELPIAAAPIRGAAAARPSLSDVFRTMPVPPMSAGFWRKQMAFVGPGYLVAVGYMDPGNWATDLSAGSQFGYTLLSVVLISGLAAMLLQALSARLGIATGRDLAQACREAYPKPVRLALWFLCELAIIACDLAELIGTAIALQLLFGIPLLVGVCLTVFDTLLILALRRAGFRILEAFVIALLVVIGVCFAAELIMSQPELGAVLRGYIPSPVVITNTDALYIAMGIVGATVMPHNLYLHSSIVQTRRFDLTDEGRRQAVKFATIDSTVALCFALFVNSAILILAAAVFHTRGFGEVAEIQDAHRLLAPLLGASAASFLFALALLASGQNSTVTATLAGEIVMEGFLQLRLPAFVRRVMTRLIAVTPAIFVTAYWGERGTGQLLILSQVVLSMQLPFAVVPLVQFTSDRARMGPLTIPRWVAAIAWVIAAVLIVLNLKLLVDFATGLFS
jgi:manganese transport protein